MSTMPVSTGAMMGMESMAMTFFTSYSTPLFSLGWTPTSPGEYTGTCIFLITLAGLFRALLAMRVNFFSIPNWVERHRISGVIAQAHRKGMSNAHKWRAREAVMLGLLDVVIAGVGYLLMIAVMTMNIGYFMSVLAGVFLGSIIFGRFIAVPAAH